MDPIGNQMDNGMKWSSLSIEDSVNLIMHDSYTLGRLMMLNSLYMHMKSTSFQLCLLLRDEFR